MSDMPATEPTDQHDPLADLSPEDAEDAAGEWVVVGPDWGCDYEEDEDDAACERATDWCTEHEGPRLSISFRRARQGEAAATYRVQRDGSLQVYGYTLRTPEVVSDLARRAYDHALESWPRPAAALLEDMPEEHRGSHRAAAASGGGWGRYPANGATRRWVEVGEAERRVAADPDGYAEIVQTATREEVLDLLRRSDSGLYEDAPGSPEDCVQLTEDACELVRAVGLTVEADAYGCAFCREQGIED